MSTSKIQIALYGHKCVGSKHHPPCATDCWAATTRYLERNGQSARSVLVFCMHLSGMRDAADFETQGFRIDGDETQAGSTQIGFSRPPSRIGQKEPIDLTEQHAAADPSQSLTWAEREAAEEAEMQDALQASLRNLPAQEIGITRGGQQFGPAVGSYHDMNKWAMTPYNATTQEIAEHPPPRSRQRRPEEPAFLRPSERTDYLPALLTIYHSIPLAREALLLPSVRNTSYGNDPNWWAGSRIHVPKVVSYDDGVLHQGDSEDFLLETQRLMAFLDGTNRSYGSADALADFECFRHNNVDSILSRFFTTWMTASMEASPDDPLTQTYNSVALKTAFDEGNDLNNKEFNCLEPTLRSDHETLYDTLDAAIWSDTPGYEALDDVWIDHVADVFTLRLRTLESNPANRPSKVGVQIPAIWYPDRYMADCKNLSRAMRAQKLELDSMIRNLGRLQNLCTTHRGSNGASDIRATLLAAAEAAELAIKDNPLANGLNEDFEAVSANGSPVAIAEGKACAQELRATVDRIDAKLKSLEEQKVLTLEMYRKVTQQLTQPSSSPLDSPRRKYTLRGVSTKAHITYVLRPVVKDLVDFECDNTENAKEDSCWQWWRISFSYEETQQNGKSCAPGFCTQTQAQGGQNSGAISASGPYSDWSGKPQQPAPEMEDRLGFSVRKVQESEVLEAAQEEHHTVLLVYANETAVERQPVDLTPELTAFVEKDNRAFEIELRKEAGLHGRNRSVTNESQRLLDDENEEMVPIPTSPKRPNEGATSPPKRFKSFDSTTGMATPPEDDDPPPYQAGFGSAGQEMQEKTASSSPLTTVRSNRIGQHAETMMAKIEEADVDSVSRDIA